MQFAVHKQIITPSHPVFMAGFGARTRQSEGVLDDLYVKTVLLRNDSDLLIVMLDALGSDHGFVDGIKAALEEHFGLRSDQVLINFSHTHASIHLTGEDPGARRGNYSIGQRDWSDDSESIDYTEDVRYFRWLRDKIVEMVRYCAENLQQGELRLGFGRSEAAVSRRQDTGNGVRWAPNFAADIDRDLAVLTVTDKGNRIRAILFNYGCHPTAMGSDNYMLSAEFVGRACLTLEAAYPDAMAAFLQGCCAELKPAKSASGATFKACNASEMREAGDELAGDVIRTLTTSAFTAVKGLFRSAATNVPLRTEPADLAAIEQWARDKGAYYLRAVERLRKLLASGTAKQVYPLSVTVWELADDVRVIALESEIPTEFALRLKTSYPGQKLLVLGYTNGVYTYIPTDRILEQGGYEADHPLTVGYTGRFVKGTEEQILEQIDDLMKQVQL